MRWQGVGLGVLTVFLVLQGLPAAQEKPAETAGVSIVEVPVFVEDGAGRPVKGLGEADFVVYEDGREQQIELFLPVMAQAPEAGRVQDASLPTSLRRQYVLLLDFCYNDMAGLTRMRKAVDQFLAQDAPPGDLVSIYTISYRYGLQQVLNFTSDRVLARKMVSELWNRPAHPVVLDSIGYSTMSEVSGISGTTAGTPQPLRSDMQLLDGSMPEVVPTVDLEEHLAVLRIYFQELNRFARSLAALPGRKFVILMSRGFKTDMLGAVPYGQQAAPTGFMEAVDGLSSSVSHSIVNLDWARDATGLPDPAAANANSFQEVTRLFASANCQVFALDTTGLYSASNLGANDYTHAEVSLSQASLGVLSGETGGTSHVNSNDLAAPIREIIGSTSHYYLMAYRPPLRDAVASNRFHSIRVAVKRGGLKVRHRTGYFDGGEPAAVTPEQFQMQVATIVNYGLEMNGIAMHAKAFAFPAAGERVPVAVVMEIPSSQFNSPGTETAFDFYGYALENGTKVSDYFHGQHTIASTQDRPAAGLRYYDLMLLPPGRRTELRLIARERTGGLIGSRSLSVDIPSSDAELRMSTPAFVVNPARPSSETGPGWRDVLGYDLSRPPARLGDAGRVFPIALRDKMLPVAVDPDSIATPTQLLLVRLAASKGAAAPGPGALEWAFDLEDAAGRMTPIEWHVVDGESTDSTTTCMIELGLPKGIAAPAWLRITGTDFASGASASDRVVLIADK